MWGGGRQVGWMGRAHSPKCLLLCALLIPQHRIFMAEVPLSAFSPQCACCWSSCRPPTTPRVAAHLHGQGPPHQVLIRSSPSLPSSLLLILRSPSSRWRSSRCRTSKSRPRHSLPRQLQRAPLRMVERMATLHRCQRCRTSGSTSLRSYRWVGLNSNLTV